MGRNRKYEDIPYIAAAFTEDVLLLLKQFSETQSFSFKEFAELWVKLKFSLVYMGKENIRELRAFTHECFNVAFKFIMAEQYTFIYKVGAVYLLYGLYFKQVEDVVYKIRMDDSRWSRILQMLKAGQEAKIPDLVFVILKLMSCMAFHSVQYISLMGPKLASQQIRDSSFGEQILKPDVAHELSSLQFGTLQAAKSALQAYEDMWTFMVDSGKFTYTQPWEKKALKEREEQHQKMKSAKDPLLWVNQYLSCKTLKDLANWQTDLVKVTKPADETIGSRRSALKSSALSTVKAPQKAKCMEALLSSPSDGEEQKVSDTEVLSPGSYYTRSSVRRELGISVEGTTTDEDNDSDIDGDLQRVFNDVALLEESDSDFAPPAETKEKVKRKTKKIVVEKKSKRSNVRKRGRRKLSLSEKLVSMSKYQMVKASHEYSKAIKGKKIIQHFQGSDDEDD